MKGLTKVISNIISVFDIIAKSRYKWWLIVLLLLAVIFAFISILFADSDIADVFIMGILVSLFINLVSSFVTIIFIEERDRKALHQVEYTKQSVAIEKMIKAINMYISFFAYLYKATSLHSINDIEQRTENMFYETDNLVQHMNRLDFFKEGYIYSPAGYIKWDQILMSETDKYLRAIQEIQDIHLSHLNNVKLIEPIKCISSYSNRVSQLHMVVRFNGSLHQLMPMKSGKCLLYPEGVEIKLPYCILNTLDTIAHTKELMAEIDNITGQSNFKVIPRLFSSINDIPKIGSAVDKDYITKQSE